MDYKYKVRGLSVKLYRVEMELVRKGDFIVFWKVDCGIKFIKELFWFYIVF